MKSDVLLRVFNSLLVRRTGELYVEPRERTGWTQRRWLPVCSWSCFLRWSQFDRQLLTSFVWQMMDLALIHALCILIESDQVSFDHFIPVCNWCSYIYACRSSNLQCLTRWRTNSWNRVWFKRSTSHAMKRSNLGLNRSNYRNRTRCAQFTEHSK